MSLAVPIVLLMAGCGASALPAGAGTSPTPVQTMLVATPQQMTPVVTAGSIGSSGSAGQAPACPSTMENIQWSAPPLLIVTQRTSGQVITLRTGQSFEVALPFHHEWVLNPDVLTPALVLDMPAGYIDTTLQSCVWHFTAHDPGEANVRFFAGAICPPRAMCPLHPPAMELPVRVTSG